MHTRTHSPSQAWSNAENVAHSIFESNAEDVCRNSNFSLKKMHSHEPLIGVPSFCIDQMVKPDNTWGIPIKSCQKKTDKRISSRTFIFLGCTKI